MVRGVGVEVWGFLCFCSGCDVLIIIRSGEPHMCICLGFALLLNKSTSLNRRCASTERPLARRTRAIHFAFVAPIWSRCTYLNRRFVSAE